MYKVSVAESFEAAHYLRGYRGKCENIHGHRFKVVVTISTVKLNEIGLAFDFVELKGHLREILASFDHTCLNEISYFSQINPSSENIATTIYEHLESRLPKDNVNLESVEIWESPQNRVTYSR